MEWKAEADSTKGKTLTGGLDDPDVAITKADGGYVVAHRFMENRDGVPCPSTRLSAMRRSIRALFGSLENSVLDRLEGWQTDANAKTQATIYKALEVEYEEFRLCDLHWKASEMCKDIFPTVKKRLKRKLDDSRAGEHEQAMELPKSSKKACTAAHAASAELNMPQPSSPQVVVIDTQT